MKNTYNTWIIDNSIYLKVIINIILNTNMNFVKINLKILVIVLFTLNSCVSLPGINKNPSKKNINNKINNSQYSIKDVGINIIKINSL